MISGTFFYEPFYRLDVARNVFHNTLLRAHYENSPKKGFFGQLRKQNNALYKWTGPKKEWRCTCYEEKLKIEL